MSRAESLWTNFCSSALDWIYPRKCSLCGRLENESPCPTCQSQMELANPNFLSESDSPLRFRACVYAYSGRSAQAVRRLKYDRCTALANFIGDEIAKTVKLLADPDEILVPVPIHVSRRADRGFNQAELCASGDHPNFSDASLLLRTRATRPQAGLSLKERQQNLANAFAASDRVMGKKILLIDDVVTSGYTARECAKVLMEAGAISVGIVAFCGNLD